MKSQATGLLTMDGASGRSGVACSTAARTEFKVSEAAIRDDRNMNAMLQTIA
ncbi:MAG: hypothetical protein ACREPU_11915 [Rhodanobacteraceae bacterium]